MKLAAFSFVAILIIQSSFVVKSDHSDIDAVNSAIKDIMEAVLHISVDVSEFIENSLIGKISKNIISIAKEAEKVLAKVEKKLSSLIILADQKAHEYERKLTVIIEELADWTDDYVNDGENVNDEDKKYIKLLITNVSQTFINNDKIRMLYEETEKTVVGSISLINSLVNKLDDCAQLNQKSRRLTTKCVSEVKKKLKPIEDLHEEYSKLFNQLDNVAETKTQAAKPKPKPKKYLINEYPM